MIKFLFAEFMKTFSVQIPKIPPKPLKSCTKFASNTQNSLTRHKTH